MAEEFGCLRNFVFINPKVFRRQSGDKATLSVAHGRVQNDKVDINRDIEAGFRSITEAIDTTTPAGTFVFHVLAAVAESERQTIVERVKGGLRNARAKGKRLGRPKKTVDVDQINSLRASGHSWRQIAAMMKLSVGTVYAAARKQEAAALCA
jgi:DNA invertase Pin-like site-specific DNA recombinase